MIVELVSPEGILFEGEASMVVARTLSGDIAFLEGHVPFIGSLAVHPIKIIMADGTTQVVAAHRGFVEVTGSKVTILSDVAELAAEIDVPRAEQARARAEEAVRLNAEDLEAHAALKRADVRLGAARGGSTTLSPGASH